MDEILRRRIERKLDGLPEDKGYQVLDYIEFLESKYGSTARPATPVERITEGVGDAMRAVRIPAEAIRGTMGVVDSASRLMERLASAGKAAVEELSGRVAASQPVESTPSAQAAGDDAGTITSSPPSKPGGPA